MGDLDAQNAIGTKYHCGECVEKDLSKVFFGCKKAAARGSVGAV